MRTSGKLTALQVQRLLKPGRYADGDKLYLRIAKGGTKAWEFRYTRDGEPHYMGLGPLRIVGLAEARQKAAEADRTLFDGKDPLTERRSGRVASRRQKSVTFNEAAKALFIALRPGWRSAAHAAQWDQSISNFAASVIGDMNVADVTTADIMRVLDPLWPTKPETASRLRGRIEAILDWARVRGYRTGENPARWKGT